MRSDDETAMKAVPGTPRWRKSVAEYETPNAWRGGWQAAHTIGGYFVLWYLIHWALAASAWLAVPLMVLAGGFLVRTFILFHDCGHGSLFKSRKANDALGFITGVLTFTPYEDWRHQHAMHHATSGNLNSSEVGEIKTMTVSRYLAASRPRRLAYRLSRHPVFLFLVAPFFMFAVRHRFPTSEARERERRSVRWTNLAILGMAVVMSKAFGLKEYLLIQGVVLAMAASAGMWLFYVQHQFEGGYREHGDRWDFTAAALLGSSYYKLPRVLQWFTGNIGFHHIHHLDPRIPNYRLQACQAENPLFQDKQPLTLFSSLRCLRLRLWDEERQKLVSVSEAHARKG